MTENWAINAGKAKCIQKILISGVRGCEAHVFVWGCASSNKEHEDWGGKWDSQVNGSAREANGTSKRLLNVDIAY